MGVQITTFILFVLRVSCQFKTCYIAWVFFFNMKFTKIQTVTIFFHFNDVLKMCARERPQQEQPQTFPFMYLLQNK